VIQQRRDGEELRVSSSVSFITNANGDLDGVVSVNRDVTEFARLQHELLKAEMDRIAVDQERELINLKEQFIATISHDFRTPLAVIVTSTEILDRYQDRLSAERKQEHLERIRDQAQYMTALLNDVLAFDKARAGKVDFNPTQFDLGDFCQSLFEQLQTGAKPEHSFIFSTDGELNEALMDERILQRVFTNLLSNAIKYSPDGGEIKFDIRRDGKEVEFQISDQGIGIPESDLQRIFEPFQRARNTQEFQGTGLGMAIVREHITFHGGQISVQSIENEGTTVTVRLPYHKEQGSN
jgi:signal transduction histidine kinase